MSTSLRLRGGVQAAAEGGDMAARVRTSVELGAVEPIAACLA
ncbi:MAG TPA: hypothetical protein VLW50_15020 [Streptosporangiaceae bacterium]|nr:hypothetical protein [Streptosporangiaceae bacterium]